MRTVDQLSKFGITGIEQVAASGDTTYYYGRDQNSKEVAITLREPDGLVMVDSQAYAPYGLWTPWASVICAQCHGNVFKSVDHEWVNGAIQFRDKVIDETSDEWKQMTELQVLKDAELTNCDECRKTIQLSVYIAREHNLVLQMNRLGYVANMDQTGGMNSAALVWIDDLNYFMIGVDDDIKSWGLCSWTRINDDDDECDQDSCMTLGSMQEVIDYLQTQELKRKEDTNGSSRKIQSSIKSKN